MARRRTSTHPMGGHELWSWDSPREVEEIDWPWANFTPFEMACRLTENVVISPAFMNEIQKLRLIVGFSLPVTSGYRSPAHNASVSSGGHIDGPHVASQAIDVCLIYSEAYRFINSAMDAGFPGLGIKQHGPTSKRFIHIDRWYSRPDRLLWTYDSKAVK